MARVSHVPRAKSPRRGRPTLAALAAFTLAGAGLTVAVAGSAQAADNLVSNPGFEDGLSGWTCSAGSGAAVSTPAHTGTGALKATPAGADNARCAQTVTVLPNSAYTLSAWVQGSYVYLGATGTGTTDPSTWTPGAGTYQQLTTTFRTGPSTTSVTVYTHGWYGQPAYYADDITLAGPGGNTQIPAVPTGLAAGAPTATSVPLSWNSVPGATGYNVYQNGTKVQSVTGTNATVTGLTANTAYDFQVSASNSAGESAKSASVTATTTGGGTQIPATPTGLAAGTPTSSSVPLSWNSVPGATGYHVYQDGTKVQSVSGTSATAVNLTASTSYNFQVSASNSAGESAKSAAVTATTGTGGGGGQLPKHVLTGYWQNFNNGATIQTIAQVPAEYDIIAVSFADATSTPGGVSFTLDPALNYSEAAFKADIAAKKAAGKKVIISVGGEKGTVSVNSSSSANNFANTLYTLIQTYGFDGVDIDLENGINSTYMSQALRSLSGKVGAGLVITMAPQTLDMQSTGTEYFKTALAIKDILTVVNTQYYNSGAMLGCDGKVYSQGTVDFMTGLACIQLEGGLAPSQVGLGLPASPRGAGSGYVSPGVVNNALDCLAKGTGCGTFKPSKTYPGLRGAMTWSTNWDALNGNQFSNTVGPHLDTLP
ncbi:glycoside hydrolase family 18 protein [Embleya sp. NPDC005971]|uniref:glycoside hydrolase family 18 protein n=1 Tax=Embleya sp. NPDC005971 TaxID=3156724 RepID=UPI0033CDF33A